MVKKYSTTKTSTRLIKAKGTSTSKRRIVVRAHVNKINRKPRKK